MQQLLTDVSKIQTFPYQLQTCNNSSLPTTSFHFSVAILNLNFLLDALVAATGD